MQTPLTATNNQALTAILPLVHLFRPPAAVSPPSAAPNIAPLPVSLPAPAVAPLQTDAPLRPPPPPPVSPPLAAASPPWSTVSLFLIVLSEALMRELLHFAGRDWRVAAFNMRLLRDQLDALAAVASAYASKRATWDELHGSALAVLAALLNASSGVQQFVYAKEAECCEALRELTSDQRWRDAQQLPPHVHMPATDTRTGTASHTRPQHVRGSSSTGSTSGTTSSPPSSSGRRIAAVASLSALSHAPHYTASRFSPGMGLSFGRVIMDVHPRDAHTLQPASLYRLLVIDMQQQPDDGGQRQQQQQQQQSAEYGLCRALLSISRCLDHLLRFHLLHHLVLFHLLGAFQRALTPAGAFSDPLTAAYNTVATASMANTHSLLTLSTHMASLMQTLQVGHTGLSPHQQREHRSLLCGRCQQPVPMPPVVLQCGHVSCYMCMLWRVRTAGASCMQCGAPNTMAQLRIDTLQSALTLTSLHQHQPNPQLKQEPTAPAIKVEVPHSQHAPTSPPPPPPTPYSLPEPAIGMAVERWRTDHGTTTDLPFAGLLALGVGHAHLQHMVDGVRADMALEEDSSSRRLSSNSLSHSTSSASSVSPSTCSSLSPSPSMSPVSPPRPIFTATRRSSLPGALSVSGSSSTPLPSSTISAGRSLLHGRSRSARILSDVCFASALTAALPAGATTAASAASTRGSPTPATPSSRSSPVPFMATVIEPPQDATNTPPPMNSQPRYTAVSSCHQCKSAKPRGNLMVCSSPAERTANRQRKCRKKYCGPCLQRCYQWSFVGGAADWSCPACEGKCICASCLRNRQQRQSAKDDLAKGGEASGGGVKEEEK